MKTTVAAFPAGAVVAAALMFEFMPRPPAAPADPITPIQLAPIEFSCETQGCWPCLLGD